MPTVILEAMACGCAIIATNVGAVSTMVSDENGWLIDNSNIEKHLEKAMTISINEEKKLFNKKLNSLKKVKNEFTWDIIIQKTIDTIKTLSVKNS